MAWKTGLNAPLGLPNAIQPITPDPAPVVPVGTVAGFVEDTLGPANLIYLPGIANVAAGDVVAYDLYPGSATVTRIVSPGNANNGRSVAVALAPVGTGQYGWFQLSGVAIVNAIAGVVAGVAFLSATAGSLGSAVIAGSQILGARMSSPVGTPAAGKAYMTLYNPFIQGQIT
jgi:hypothetical protein